jgi:hypothetical protein
MIYRIYDQLSNWHGLQNPSADSWASVEVALTSLAKEAGFGTPIFDSFGNTAKWGLSGLEVRFEDTSDIWQLTYDKGAEFALTLREHCEINNQDFEESFVFNCFYPQ